MTASTSWCRAGFAEQPERRQRLRPAGAGRAGRARLGRGHPRGRSRPASPALPALPDGALVLVDGLVASWAADRPAGGRTPVRSCRWCTWPFETPGERELLAAAPAVVTTSGWTRRWLLEHYGLDAGPGARRGPRAWRWPTRCPGPRRAASCSASPSVLPAKGHDVLLAALAALTDLDWRCTLVGSLDARPGLRRRAAQGRRGQPGSPTGWRSPGALAARRPAERRTPAADAAGAALARRDLRDGGHRGAGPRAAGDRERGRRRTGSARARRRRQHPRGAGAAGRRRRAGRGAAPLARGPAAPAAAAPLGRAAAADAADVVADHPQVAVALEAAR